MAHVAAECGAGGVLMLMTPGEYQGGGKGDGQGVCDRLVVLAERIFLDVEAKTGVQVFEEYPAEVVAFADDDGVFVAEVGERGECGTEHGVGAHERVAGFGVELGKSGLDRGDVAQDGAWATGGGAPVGTLRRCSARWRR